MTNPPKINLSAMKKVREVKKDISIENSITKENLEIENISSINESNNYLSSEVNESQLKNSSTNIVNEEKVSLIPKIYLSSIKTNKSTDEKKEETEKIEETKHKEKKEELLEALSENNQKEILEETKISWIKINEIKKLEKTEEKVPEVEKTTINNIEGTITSNINTIPTIETKKLKDDVLVENAVKTESLKDIEKKISEKVNEEIDKKNLNKKREESVIDDSSELFWNYKSEFEKKEEKIIESVEIKRNRFREKLKEPKTRIALVLWLIILTIWTISALFILSPENHSFEKYKTSIINNVSNINNKFNKKDWILEIINIENINFDTYYQKDLLWNTKYKYKDIIYSSKDDLKTLLNKEVILQKKEIERKKIEEENNKRIEEIRLADEKKRQEEEERLLQEKEKTKVIIKDILYDKYKNNIN